MRLPVVLLSILMSPAPVLAQNFTTVEEVKPILTALQPSWIVVRDWKGQDLLYFTQLESWRCGLREIRYRVNDGAEAVKAMEPCYTDAPSPNAFKDNAHLSYISYPSGSVERVSVTVVYADGSEASATFERADVELR